jgi:hypothetical protein
LKTDMNVKCIHAEIYTKHTQMYGFLSMHDFLLEHYARVTTPFLSPLLRSQSEWVGVSTSVDGCILKSELDASSVRVFSTQTRLNAMLLLSTSKC